MLFEKLKRKIAKNKYTCQILNNDTELEFATEYVKVLLKLVEKSDTEKLKQDLCHQYKELERVKGVNKLFRYYFLIHWMDKYKKELN